MKQIMLAFNSYLEEHGHYPPAYTVDEEGKPLHSWRVLILPYIEQTALYEKIRLDEPWDSEHNRQFHRKTPNIFQCPSHRQLVHGDDASVLEARGGSFYSVVHGEETAFFSSQPRRLTETTSLSETIFLVERRVPVHWMDPSREMSFETAIQGVHNDAMGISSYHPRGGAHVVFGDGSVRFLPSNTDSVLLRKALRLQEEK